VLHDVVRLQLPLAPPRACGPTQGWANAGATPLVVQRQPGTRKRSRCACIDAGGGAGASAGQVNERDPFMRDVQAGGGAGGRASLPSPSKSSLSLASLALAGRLPTYTDCAARARRDTRARLA